MTDRKLLELAAKAAGIDLWIDTRSGFRNGADGDTWNPLEDDGDALRLVVKLKLPIIRGMRHSGNPYVSCHREWDVMLSGYFDVGTPIDNDPYAATRRAIVRAAAALALEEGVKK